MQGEGKEKGKERKGRGRKWRGEGKNGREERASHTAAALGLANLGPAMPDAVNSQ